MNRIPIAAAFYSIVILFGCSQNAIHRNSSTTVFAAASTTDAMEDAMNAFETQDNISVKTNFAGSGILARQIESGADCDLFLSANAKWADYIAGKGSVNDRSELLINSLVVVVPRDSKLRLASPQDLIHDSVEHIALGDPESVPAGIYAKQALEALHLWHKLEPRIVRGSDVRQALMFVERGEADAGMVYSTDAAISERVSAVCTIDPTLIDPIVYPLVLIQPKGREPSESARQLFEFLQSPQAGEIFRKYGFTVSRNE